ncbi:ankyrin repeat-containing domain protein [Pelagophyceae sp. CCMP2097]|nr:ankyrin repeat-containing domain protein [Pelagophyceae sp. CCMP2097]
MPAEVNGKALKLYTGCYDGKLDEVKRLCETTDGDEEPLDVNCIIHGGTAFAAAVQNGHLDIIKYLVSCGADVNHPIHDGATPIFIAAYRGYLEIVNFLISHNADLETPNSKGNTPFFIACQHCRLDIADVLAANGVKLEPVNEAGSTPFFFACQEGNADVVKFLVDRQVNTTAGKNGITPFHMACYRGHIDVVKYLVQGMGMDPLAIDGHGRTPLEVARRAQRDDVVTFLESINPEATAAADATACMQLEDTPCTDVGCAIA